MELSSWWPWYEKIASAFGYAIERDREATLVLRELLSEAPPTLAKLGSLIKGKSVMVFGAGPSLEDNMAKLVSTNLDKQVVLVVADGATTAFLEQSISPHIVITDLDGCLEDIVEAGAQGSTIVIHGHGDNIDTLRKWVPQILERSRANVFGSTQVEPIPPAVHNFGGFTDGDRGVFLAEEMKATSIILAAMDLGTTIGKYSKNLPADIQSRNSEDAWLAIKKLKLRFAKELLEWLATRSRVKSRLFNVTGSRGETIRGFAKIDFKDLKCAPTKARR